MSPSIDSAVIFLFYCNTDYGTFISRRERWIDFFFSLFGNANTEASRQQTVVHNYLFKQREKCLKCYRKRAINANFMDNLASGSLCSHWIFLNIFFKIFIPWKAILSRCKRTTEQLSEGEWCKLMQGLARCEFTFDALKKPFCSCDFLNSFVLTSTHSSSFHPRADVLYE